MKFVWDRLTAPLRRLFGKSAKDARDPFVAGAYRAYASGRYEDAERLCAQRLEAEPGDNGALHVRGLLLIKHGQYPEALSILESLVGKATSVAEYHDARGLALLGLQRYDDSLASFNRALELNPQLAATHNNVSVVRNLCDEHAQAEAAARAALRIDPRFGLAQINLGVTLMAQDRLGEAELELRRAVDIDPGSQTARLKLCEALHAQDKVGEARAELERVRQIQPDNPDAHLHLGNLAQDFEHDVPTALKHYRVAQQLAPRSAAPFFNEGLLRLMNGEFARPVWDLYEYRKKVPDRRDSHPEVDIPDWDGSKIDPGGLLVYSEQGLGDDIMFASILPQLVSVAPRPHIAAHPRLHTLFARSFAEAEVFSWDRGAREPDQGAARRAVAFGSLPRFFRCSLADFPSHSAYLVPDPMRVEEMRALLDNLGPGLRIGISWRGGTARTRRARRSINLDDFARLLGRPGSIWINLQHGAAGGAVEKEIDRLERSSGVAIETLHDATDDLEGSAALIASLDLVISVCNTTVHLAGALGKPVWVLAPFSPEWRYGVSGPRMPWYPSAKLFRQPVRGSWKSVIAEVGAQLDSLQG